MAWIASGEGNARPAFGRVSARQHPACRAATFKSRQADIQPGGIGPQCFAANQDRVGLCPHGVDVRARLRPGDPLAAPSASAIQPSSDIASFSVTCGRPRRRREKIARKAGIGFGRRQQVRVDPGFAQAGQALVRQCAGRGHGNQ